MKRPLRIPAVLLALLPLAASADELPVPPEDPTLPRAAAPVGESAATLLPPLEVTGLRRPIAPFESPRASSVSERRDQDERQVRFAPDALRETVGVTVQQTAYGQGSPIIRGLQGNQVLILVDGIRLNNSTYRFGANQYLATIDAFTIDRVEVVRGPGSVLYGSDALGGTVNVITKSREGFDFAYDLEGEAIGRHGTAADEWTGRIGAEGNIQGAGAIGGFTASDFDDLRAGGDTNEQPNTAYSQQAADLKLNYRLEGLEVVLAHQCVVQRDVPRSDRLNLALPGRTPANEKLEFDPQRRNLTYLSATIDDTGLPIAAVRSNVSFQRQEEHRDEIATSRPDRETKDKDVVDTWGTSNQLETVEIARQVFTFGGEWYGDTVDSEREQISLTTGESADVRPRFADHGTYRTLGLFLQDEVRVIPDRVVLTVGGRWTHVEVDGDFTDPDPAIGTVDLDETYDALTGSAYLWVSPIDEVALVGGVAQGFRAPNFDDLSVFGQAAGGFEVPNTDVDPERALSTEIGVKWRAPGDDPLFTGSVFGHWTEVQELLQRAPGELDGRDFVDSDGDGTQDANELPVITRQNVGRARIFGVEADGLLRIPKIVSALGERWSVHGNFTWTYGKDLENDAAVRGIPPARGIAAVRCDAWEDRVFFEGVGEFVRAQEKLNPADLTDPRIPPGGTPGYSLFHLRAGARLAMFRAAAPFREGSLEKDYNAAVTLALENFLDREYRVHGSGIDGPGINFVATLGVRF